MIINPTPKLCKLVYELFKGRRDTWAVQKRRTADEIEYFRVTGKELTLDTIRQHIIGEETIGIYPLLPNDRVYFACIDVDVPNYALARRVQLALPSPTYAERSRSGNYHLWMFFKEPVDITDLEKACKLGINLAKAQSDGEHCALYPTPLRKDPTKDQVGMLIALPFQYEAAKRDNSIFIDDTGAPMADQYEYLALIDYIDLSDICAYDADSILTDAKIKRLYMGTGKKGGDTSQSGYDFSFCQALAQRGLDKPQITELLRKRPQVSQTSDEYIDRTVDAAWASCQRDIKLSVTKQHKPEVKVVTWDDIKEVSYSEFNAKCAELLIFEEEQLKHYEMFFACMVANLRMKGAPVWLMIIGPPGCGKTIPMMAVRNSPVTLMTSSLRPTSLISGFGLKGGEDMSLIPKLQDKILLVKDMSSLLSQNKEVLAEVLGMLRDAYDGQCGRIFGTGVERVYASRFGFVGASTPDIDANWGLHVRLGERFIKYRVRSQPEHIYQKIEKALGSLFIENENDDALEEVALGYLKMLLDESKPMPRLGMVKEISRLAQLGAILRTAVATSKYTKEVLTIPEWEEATRYAKQLGKIAVALAHIRGKEINDNEELEDLKKLVRDGLDARTERICHYIYQCDNEEGIEASEIANAIGLPEQTIRQCLTNMQIARIAVRHKDGFKLRWQFVPWIKGQLTVFKLWDSKKEVYWKGIN